MAYMVLNTCRQCAPFMQRMRLPTRKCLHSVGSSIFYLHM